MKNKALEIKKIEKKIELDTTQEGFFDCGKCYGHIATSYVDAGTYDVCYKVTVSKKNTPFAPA